MRKFTLNTGQRIYVVGRDEIQSPTFSIPKCSTAYISICDPIGLGTAKIETRYGDTRLYLAFDDISCRLDNMIPMSDEQAAMVAEFIKDCRKHKQFVCQCEAGISRSAGVAMAIAWYLTEQDRFILNDRYLRPNRYVYSKLVIALGVCR